MTVGLCVNRKKHLGHQLSDMIFGDTFMFTLKFTIYLFNNLFRFIKITQMKKSQLLRLVIFFGEH